MNTILENLSAISALPKENYNFHITIRHNILTEDTDFSWYDYLYNLFGSDERFQADVCPVCDWGGENVKKLPLAAPPQHNRLISAHNAYLDKIGLRRGHLEDTPFSYICSASYKFGFIFRADGRIEKCTIALDHPNNMVGHVDDCDGVVIDAEKNNRWISKELRPVCYTCPQLLSCLNVCCMKRIIIDGKDEPVCLCSDSTTTDNLV